MSLDLILALVFYLLLLLFYFTRREKFTVQGKIFFLYKTKLGLRGMDYISKKFPLAIRIFAFFGVVVGYAGMGYIFYMLVTQTYQFLTVEGTTPPLAPVFPGIQIPGAPQLSFLHWILAIFIIAIIHEFSHGVLARSYGVKVKSSGFAFLGPILAAFVEPDEKSLQKKKYGQLAVYAAGPFANILFAFGVILLVQFAFFPLMEKTLMLDGVMVGKTLEGYPMEQTNISTPFTMYKIDNAPLSSPENFFQAISAFQPSKEVSLFTDQGTFIVRPVSNPENSSAGFIGITEFNFNYKVSGAYSFLPAGYVPFLRWIELLLVWLFIISLGVGLFNLLPLGPVDGGRIFFFTVLHIVKDKKKAGKIFNIVSLFILLLIVANLLPYVIKFMGFIFNSLGVIFGAGL